MKTRLIRKSDTPRLSVTSGWENFTFFFNDHTITGRKLYPYTAWVQAPAFELAFKDYRGTLDELRVLAESAAKWSDLLVSMSGGQDNADAYLAKVRAK